MSNKDKNIDPLSGPDNPYSDLWANLGKSINRKRQSIKEEVLANDNRLTYIVEYQLTEGYTKIPPKIDLTAMVKSGEVDRVKMAEQLQQGAKKDETFRRLFTEFKRGIFKGEYTLDELEAMVYSKHGIISEETESRIETIDDVEFMSEKERAKMEEEMGNDNG